MKLLLTLCLTFLFLSAVSQSPVDTLHWYKCMKGTIGKYGVTMQLHRNGHEYSGYYYYESSQQPMDLGGKDSAGMVLLDAYIPANLENANVYSESFRGNW